MLCANGLHKQEQKHSVHLQLWQFYSLQFCPWEIVLELEQLPFINKKQTNKKSKKWFLKKKSKITHIHIFHSNNIGETLSLLNKKIILIQTEQFKNIFL